MVLSRLYPGNLRLKDFSRVLYGCMRIKCSTVIARGLQKTIVEHIDSFAISLSWGMLLRQDSSCSRNHGAER